MKRRATSAAFFFALHMLQPSDFQSKAWKRLTSSLHARLQELRESNDTHVDPMQTAAIRGSIAEVKRILALDASASARPAVTPEELLGDDEFIEGY